MQGGFLSSAAVLVALLSGGPYVVEGSQELPMKQGIVTELSALSNPRSWLDESTMLVSPGTNIVEKISAKAVIYQRATGPLFLAIVPNRHTGYVHLVRWAQTMFLADGEELWGCQITPGDVFLARSYARRPMPATLDLAITGFVPDFDVDKLSQADAKRATISLEPGVPHEFFLMGSNPNSSTTGRLSIASVEFVARILQLNLVSDGGKFNGSFWIDLDSQKLLRTVLDGKEVFRAK
jgi:hypothetical protein